MKTNIFSKGIKYNLLALSFVLVSGISFGADPPVNKNFTTIVDSISVVMKEKYGYDLKLDSSLKNGCLNYYKEIKGKSVEPVDGQAHIHSSAQIPLEYYNHFPYSYFYQFVSRTIEKPEFSWFFEVYKPTKFWVEEVIVGDQCYFIVALD